MTLDKAGEREIQLMPHVCFFLPLRNDHALHLLEVFSRRRLGAPLEQRLRSPRPHHALQSREVTLHAGERFIQLFHLRFREPK